jgi:hypothetical protein
MMSKPKKSEEEEEHKTLKSHIINHWHTLSFKHRLKLIVKLSMVKMLIKIKIQDLYTLLF